MWEPSVGVWAWGLRTVRVIGARTGRIWARLARRSRRDERGSALVEAAIILPVIALLTFGAIDFGIGFNQKAGLDSAVRSGARVGATERLVDNPPVCSGTPPCNTQLGVDVAAAVNTALTKLSSVPQLTNLFVYRIDGGTHLPLSVTDKATCLAQKVPHNPSDASCIYFDVDPANAHQFDVTKPHGTWPDDTNPGADYDRLACPQDGSLVYGSASAADRIGVTITGKFHFLTGMIGTTVNLTASAANQLEPNGC